MNVIYLKETDSTNRQLRLLAEEGAPEGTTVAAEYQTAGRGRLGRSFFSPAGSGLYFSILLRPQGAAVDALQITVTAAVAVAQAVQKQLGLELQIKWVNDLYYKGRKVCGILAEGRLNDRGGLDYCVLGIGLNVFAPRGGFGELESIAGALLEQDPGEDARRALLQEIIHRFFALYRNSDGVMEEYRRRSFLKDKWVTVVRGEERIRARVLDVDDAGALVTEDEEGQRRSFSSGEVALEDYR